MAGEGHQVEIDTCAPPCCMLQCRPTTSELHMFWQDRYSKWYNLGNQGIEWGGWGRGIRDSLVIVLPPHHVPRTIEIFDCPNVIEKEPYDREFVLSKLRKRNGFTLFLSFCAGFKARFLIYLFDQKQKNKGGTDRASRKPIPPITMGAKLDNNHMTTD